MKRVMTIAAAGFLPCGTAKENTSLMRSFARACVKRGAEAVLFPACAYGAEAEKIAKQFGVYLIFGADMAGEGFQASAVCQPCGGKAEEGDANALAAAAAELLARYPDGPPDTFFHTAVLRREGADAV